MTSGTQQAYHLSHTRHHLPHTITHGTISLTLSHTAPSPSHCHTQHHLPHTKMYFLQILRSLNRTYINLKMKPVWQDLNPKAITTDELYGFINPATREWKDGLYSTIMRDMSNLTNDYPKWIVLDGDVDPMWIESLNTVMDDNKVCTQ